MTKQFAKEFGKEGGIWIEFYQHSDDEDLSYKETVIDIYCTGISIEYYEKNAQKIRENLEKTFNIPVTFTEF